MPQSIIVAAEVDRSPEPPEIRPCKFVVDFDSDEAEVTALYMKSPDGTRWKITVDNAGVLTTEAA